MGIKFLLLCTISTVIYAEDILHHGTNTSEMNEPFKRTLRSQKPRGSSLQNLIDKEILDDSVDITRNICMENVKTLKKGRKYEYYINRHKKSENPPDTVQFVTNNFPWDMWTNEIKKDKSLLKGTCHPKIEGYKGGLSTALQNAVDKP
ncbi:unnamed protein product [Ranitomeya imitator]|uniref:Uncharacterized protein n=1 Tax=Ranitomeya imitator TaxID=111125 RepID=A0ABN9L2L7_9NEOB|nr:unnamed protein product [Ranitomeya imitator]